MNENWTLIDVVIRSGLAGWFALLFCGAGVVVGVWALAVRLRSGTRTVLGFYAIVPLLAAGAVSFYFRAANTPVGGTPSAQLIAVTDRTTRYGAICGLLCLAGVVAGHWRFRERS